MHREKDFRRPARLGGDPRGHRTRAHVHVALAQRLAGALRFKTISFQDSSQFDAHEFDGFQRYLRTTFPKLHAALKLEKVNGYGLLYEWPGSDPGAPPIVLLAHQDVVPVEPGTETRWTEPPFEGRIAGGYVWGRGALDEGGALSNGLIAGVSAAVAVVGIAENGYVTVGLTAQAEGGHSSMPPDE